MGVQPAAQSMLDQARANFKRWNDALQTKNPQTVADMYVSEELSFLPTVSPQHIKAGGAASKTEDYFIEFVKKNPFGTIIDDSVQVFNDGDAYLHSGLYTFELGPVDARTPVEARFSYVWKKVAGDWKISHHHSSVMPASAPSHEEMLATAHANFKTWNDALQTKDAKNVAKLYVSDGLSFLPTVSPDHIKAGGVTSGTEDYFAEFVKKNPFGTITDDSVEVFSNGASYLHSGLYTFELGHEGVRTPVEARFSYVWKKDGGAWKISHHHSSVRPEGAANADAKQERWSFWRRHQRVLEASARRHSDKLRQGPLHAA